MRAKQARAPQLNIYGQHDLGANTRHRTLRGRLRSVHTRREIMSSCCVRAWITRTHQSALVSGATLASDVQDAA